MKQFKISSSTIMLFFALSLITTSCKEEAVDKTPSMQFRAENDIMDLSTAAWKGESYFQGGRLVQRITISNISKLRLFITLRPSVIGGASVVKEGKYYQYAPSELTNISNPNNESRCSILISKAGINLYESPTSSADKAHSPLEIISIDEQASPPKITLKFKGNLVRASDAKLVPAEFYYSYE
ncbi:MAG: hypothetical protein KIT62_11040 [Cyclobacteriaceae bacterium]|nr:hypothetical protein [Cyclobacteriaceae bacterium]